MGCAQTNLNLTAKFPKVSKSPLVSVSSLSPLSLLHQLVAVDIDPFCFFSQIYFFFALNHLVKFVVRVKIQHSNAVVQAARH